MMTINNSQLPNGNDSNPRKDWEDFWYNSKQIYPPESNFNYNELVDYQVHSMNRFESLSDTMNEPPFDTQAYRNYKELVNKKREEIDGDNITETIMKLGFKLDQLLSKIISQLDTIIEDNKDAK